MSISKRFLKPRNYFPLFSFILELIAILLIVLNNNSICAVAHEISTNIHIFVLTIGQFLVPDLIFVLLVFTDSKTVLRPFGFVYNMYATIMCVLGSLFLLVGLTFCGNYAQIAYLCSGICGGLSAGAHFGSIYEVGMGMPKEEKFAMKR